MNTLLRRRMMIAGGGEPPTPPVPTETATFVISSIDTDNSIYQSVQSGYPLSNAYEGADSSTYASVKWKNGVEAYTKMYWKFDTSTLPAGATIVSVELSVKASLSTANYQTGSSFFCVCRGTTEVGNHRNMSATSAKVYDDIDCGSGWTVENIQNIAVLFQTQRGTSNETANYYQRMYGATLTVTYIGDAPTPEQPHYFRDKNISIIGDSISTYNSASYKYDSYPTHYPSGDVNSVNKTWWKLLMDNEIASLVENLSYSGSTAATRSGYVNLCDRVSLIGNCDTVIIALGTNDSLNSLPLGDYSYEKAVSELDETYFREAYIKGIKQIQAIDSTIDIVCAIFYMSDDYRNSIKAIAEHYGLTVVDCGNDYDKESGVHPDATGMEQIYEEFLTV